MLTKKEQEKLLIHYSQKLFSVVKKIIKRNQPVEEKFNDILHAYTFYSKNTLKKCTNFATWELYAERFSDLKSFKINNMYEYEKCFDSTMNDTCFVMYSELLKNFKEIKNQGFDFSSVNNPYIKDLLNHLSEFKQTYSTQEAQLFYQDINYRILVCNEIKKIKYDFFLLDNNVDFEKTQDTYIEH